jgi:short-subunit dehydrogenase
VNISSVAARLSPPGEAVYAASKAALTSFSEALAIELWDQPVDVHIVNPGVVDTELFDPNMPDNDQFVADDVERLPPSAVLDAVLDALDQGSARLHGRGVRVLAREVVVVLTIAARTARPAEKPDVGVMLRCPSMGLQS